MNVDIHLFFFISDLLCFCLVCLSLLAQSLLCRHGLCAPDWSQNHRDPLAPLLLVWIPSVNPQIVSNKHWHPSILYYDRVMRTLPQDPIVSGSSFLRYCIAVSFFFFFCYYSLVFFYSPFVIPLCPLSDSSSSHPNPQQDVLIPTPH